MPDVCPQSVSHEDRRTDLEEACSLLRRALAIIDRSDVGLHIGARLQEVIDALEERT